MDWKPIKEEEIGTLGYGRIGWMELLQWKCDRCGEVKLCVAFDPSEGEYGAIVICKDCFLKFIEED